MKNITQEKTSHSVHALDLTPLLQSACLRIFAPAARPKKAFGHVLREVNAWDAGKEHNGDHAARHHRTTRGRRWFPDEPA
jgi:hypothetical protein